MEEVDPEWDRLEWRSICRPSCLVTHWYRQVWTQQQHQELSRQRLSVQVRSCRFPTCTSSSWEAPDFARPPPLPFSMPITWPNASPHTTTSSTPAPTVSSPTSSSSICVPSKLTASKLKTSPNVSWTTPSTPPPSPSLSPAPS